MPLITVSAVESLNDDLQLADAQEGDYYYALESAKDTVGNWCRAVEENGNADTPAYYWDLMHDYEPGYDYVDFHFPYGTDTARVISTEDGGVIAYVHKDNADRFVTALTLAG